MRIFKKMIITLFIAIIAILSFIPSSVEAYLTDAQRQAIVNVTSELITKLGQNGRVLRYSQAHRTSGYNNLRKVTGSGEGVLQTTQSTFTLTSEDQAAVLAAFKQDIAKKYANNEEIMKKYNAITQLSQLAKGAASYRCLTYGADINDTIAFDCSSLVSYLYKASFGGTFLWTTSNFKDTSTSSKYFQKISVSEAKPGDVLWKEGHVGIYLGDYDHDGVVEVAEAAGFVSSMSASAKAQISAELRDYLIAHPTAIKGHPQYRGTQPSVHVPGEAIRPANTQVCITDARSLARWTCAYTYTAEVRQGTAIDVTGITTTNTGNNTGAAPSTSSDGATGGLSVEQVNNTRVVLATKTVPNSFWPDDYKLADEELPNSKDFFHKGIPAYGGYSQIVTPLNWLIEKAGDVLDWLIGFVTYALKVEIVGWTSIVENLVSNALSLGTQNMDAITESSGATVGEKLNNALQELSIATKNKVTVEDVIFNNVPLLDINFFDFSTAAGKQLDQNSAIYKIRELIAEWYYTIRTVAIILMLVILLYTSVRAIFTSAAKDRSVAKEKAIDWLIGFLIVFAIHYFMVGVVWLNNQVVQILKPATQTQQVDDSSLFAANRNTGSITQNSEESLYEQIRVQAYDLSAVSGWTGTFMYVAMVIYLFIFVVMYIKRLFILALLTVISPIVGALYAFNKSKYGLSTWGKDYVYNVIIQLIHAVVYTVLIYVALQVAKTSTIVGGIIALILMGFMFTLEKIVKNIFNYDASSLGGLSDSLAAQVGLYHVGKKATIKLGHKTVQAGHLVQKIGDKAVHNEYVDKIAKSKYMQNIHDYYTQEEARFSATGAYIGSKVSETVENTVNKVNNWIDGKDDNEINMRDLDSPAPELKARPTYEEFYQHYYNKIKYGKYVASPALQSLIDERRKKSNEAKKQFLKSRVSLVLNSAIATAGGALAIPMLVVNRQTGLAIAAFGTKSFMNAFKRKTINGIKAEKTKLTAKKMLFYTATIPAFGPLAPAYENAYDNAKAEKAELERIERKALGKEMDTLQKARRAEADLVEVMQEMYADAPKEHGQLQSSLNLVEKRALREAMKSSLQKLDKDTVEKIVFEYLERKNTNKIGMSEIKEIARKINKALPEDQRISDSFTNNIRDQIRRKSRMKPVIETKTVDKKGRETIEIKARVEVKDIEKICREIGKEEKIDSDIVKDLIIDLRKDKHFATVMKTQDTEKITNVIKDKLEEKVLDAEKHEEMAKKFHEKLEKTVNIRTRQDEMAIQKKLKQLETSEVIKLINIALTKENSIDVILKNNRYNDMMKKLRKLDEVNQEYYALTGEKIYKDVGKLVENIRDGIIKD